MRIHADVKGPLVSRMEGTRLLSELRNCGFPHSSREAMREDSHFPSCVSRTFTVGVRISVGRRRGTLKCLWYRHICRQDVRRVRRREKKKNGGPPRPSPTTSCDNEQHSFSLCRPGERKEKKKQKRCEALPISDINLRPATDGGVGAAEFLLRPLNNDVLG